MDIGVENDVIETDSSGRFVRVSDVLGHGAFKTVYKGIDRERGIAIAWNQLKLTRGLLDASKIYAEIKILEVLDHPNIVDLYASWVNEENNEIVFITECMSSGTLNEYLPKVRGGSGLRIQVLQSWCRQILEGLNYLHTRDPPIIHRDIKCDNIFIDASVGIVKIGDLGLATLKDHAARIPQSVIGTPQFMAPEFYMENYDEKVDIWAFGLCVLEIVTDEYPYHECENPAQVFKKVTSGLLPQSLSKVENPEILRFIQSCLVQAQKRPSAKELLDCFFFQKPESQNQNQNQNQNLNNNQILNQHNPFSINVIDLPAMNSTATISVKSLSPINTPPDKYFQTQTQHQNQNQNQNCSTPDSPSAIVTKVTQLEIGNGNNSGNGSQNEKENGIDIKNDSDKNGNENGEPSSGSGSLKSKPALIDMTLSHSGISQAIQFEFNASSDTPLDVASEMVQDLGLPNNLIGSIVNAIDEEMAATAKINHQKNEIENKNKNKNKNSDHENENDNDLHFRRRQHGEVYQSIMNVGVDSISSDFVSDRKPQGIVPAIENNADHLLFDFEIDGQQQKLQNQKPDKQKVGDDDDDSLMKKNVYYDMNNLDISEDSTQPSLNFGGISVPNYGFLKRSTTEDENLDGIGRQDMEFVLKGKSRSMSTSSPYPPQEFFGPDHDHEEVVIMMEFRKLLDQLELRQLRELRVLNEKHMLEKKELLRESRARYKRFLEEEQSK